MRDGELGGLLRRLPRARASSSFTESVLARLDRRRPERPRLRRPALAAVVATGVLVVLFGALLLVAPERTGDGAEVAASRERVERLQFEYESLERQLEELRLLAAESQPLVGVQSADGVDYLVDLRELLANGRTRTASYRSPPSDG